MTNDEVEAFWLKHGKKPRVQMRRHQSPVDRWDDCIGSGPKFFPCLEYRIRPEDLEKFTMQQQPKLDVTKPVQTRDGRAARVICTDAKSARSIVALVNVNGTELVRSFCPDGKVSLQGEEGEPDLINVPPQVQSEVYRNVYGTGSMGSMFNSAERAKSEASPEALGLIKITTFTDGTFTVEKVEDTTPTV